MEDIHETPYVQCRRCNYYKVGRRFKNIKRCERCGATGEYLVERKVEGTGWHYVGDMGGMIPIIGVVFLLLELFTSASPFKLFGLNCSESPPACILILFGMFFMGMIVWGFASYKDREGMKKRIEHELTFLQQTTPTPSAQPKPTPIKPSIHTPPPVKPPRSKSKIKLADALQSQISQLKAKDANIYFDDVNELITKAKDTSSNALLEQARKLLEEKEKMLDRRIKLTAEFNDINETITQMSLKVGKGEISDQTFRDAKSELDIRKIEIQDELGEIDYKLYKEEYEKPVF